MAKMWDVAKLGQSGRSAVNGAEQFFDRLANPVRLRMAWHRKV